MILAVLVGNTNTSLTWFRDRRIARRRRLPTQRLLGNLPSAFEPDSRVSGVALASVVPRATVPVRAALRRRFGVSPFQLTATSRTGLRRIDYDRSQLGADRLCAAVGARARHTGNVIVADFGTAVTVDAVTEAGRFLGGVILPGLATMSRALHSSTGRLPDVKPAGTDKVLAHTTKAAIRSGTTHALLGGLARIISRFESETGLGFRVIATGGGAKAVRKRYPRIDALDPYLAAYGLLELHRLNRPGRDAD